TSIYGIPFAGDALVMAYNPSLLKTPPKDLETVLALGEVLVYPPADPQALFSLCTYLANGGSLQDKEGRPTLDEATLVDIFEYYQKAGQAGVMPVWLTELSTDAQVWEAFQGSQYPLAFMWASTYLSHMNGDSGTLAIAPLPTKSGSPFTLATGWSWTLTDQDSHRRAQAVTLVEYLVDDEFLGKWTSAAGYLPPKGIPLQYWSSEELRVEIASISISAIPAPQAEVTSSLGPALEQAVVSVLKTQADPETAAQTVINQIHRP
ncbi:MAG TPA: extracellular solute-binding protein, partial [Anaerolineales bacterium]